MPASEARSCLIELHYLPCIQYISKFVLYDQVVIEQFENYQKGSYRNKCHILATQGPHLLTVPLRSGKHERQPMRDVRIAYDINWARHHWQAIASAYGRSPYFDHYSEELRRILTANYKYLFDLNLDLLQWVIEALDLRAPVMSSSYERRPGGSVDLRNTIVRRPGRASPDAEFNAPIYVQQFIDRLPFTENLSIIDMLFATGPEAKLLLAGAVRRPAPGD